MHKKEQQYDKKTTHDQTAWDAETIIIANQSQK